MITANLSKIKNGEKISVEKQQWSYKTLIKLLQQIIKNNSEKKQELCAMIDSLRYSKRFTIMTSASNEMLIVMDKEYSILYECAIFSLKGTGVEEVEGEGDSAELRSILVKKIS
ncbi:MAG: hypothetical protein PHG05_02470 [Candidatus Nanoarchaeia archaeon]|nr:hypothetical protein [Candidatus Nanoarchaeia archaeon]